MKMFVDPSDIYLLCGYVDFRKSINGLLVIIEHELTLSPFSNVILSFATKKKRLCERLLYRNAMGQLDYSRR